MKVIVNVSGFYAGTWYAAGPKAVEMADAIAKPFLPPRGDQLSLAKAERATAAADKKAG
ncbi:hypothetical protein [Kaistia nematophila]|uniref:Uncharacterized protein n=1 Tax=Kaistia nematophila TaxID=2994654 RepID=A0A9X3E454_9HYPH|nr:hypothetical protein [Kaistia nematophila]MCX5571481.1 hypothetical protein [Kaistia nematophila]